MDNPAAPAAALNIEQLFQRHTLTREVAKFCQKQLRGYLDTTSVLFRPRRFLGDYMEGTGREPVAGSERTFAELQELYRRFALKPFDLRPELPAPLPSVPTQLVLYDWEYPHSVQTERGWETIRIASPLTWVLSYASPSSLPVLRQQLQSGQHQKEPEAVRAFVLRACLMYILIEKHPAVADLLGALRFRVETRTIREFGELPLVTVSAPFATVRPPDDLVVKAAGFAGGASFTEVLDLESVRQLRDPLREEAARLLRQHGEEI
jgi:hypothetical protein